MRAGMRVSVIIPAHVSTDPYMAETLASVCAQTVQPVEIIVVRDEWGQGPAVIRNSAANRAQGEWLLLLDADDTIDPCLIEAAQTVVAGRTGDPFAIAISDAPLTDAIYHDNYLPYCALIRRSIWLRLDGYREPSALGNGLCDWDWWIRLHRTRLPIAYVPGNLFHHRDREGSMSKWTSEHFEAMRADLWRRHGIIG